MGSILSKGNENSINNNNEHNDIFIDCNDISSMPSTLISNHLRQPSIRSRNLQPMPTISELDRRFAKVLVSVNLIPKSELYNKISKDLLQ